MKQSLADIDQIWNKVLTGVRLKTSDGTYKAYLRPTRLIEIKENEGKKIAIVGCQSTFIKNTIDQRLASLICEELNKDQNGEWVLEYKIETNGQTNKQITKEEVGPLFEGKKIVLDEAKRARLRPDYVFDNYAVGGSNQMAFAAAQAVARNPGHSYNPLFIYGGVGVGKTHLMQAIGHAVLEKGEGEVLFSSGEEFTNDLVEAIRYKTTEKVRAKYRRLKVLMIDDVQFIAGKPSVQEEFFHTFNTISSAGGQVIMTSDKPPSEIAKLEERLKSRFGAGLIVDIGPADFELRTAILLIKSKQRGMELPMELAQLIATHIEGVRELQGVLGLLETEHNLTGNGITRERLESLLKINKSKNELARIVTPAEVINAVGNFYQVGVQQLKGDKRNKTIVWPRQILMYLLRCELRLPQEEVGRLVGGRDHTTVIHAEGKIREQLETNQQLKKEIEEIKRIIFST